MTAEPKIRAKGASERAVSDLMEALEIWRLWVRLGWHDMLRRYRRSVLGPLWFTLSNAITIVALGLVYSQVLNFPARELLPHVAIGLSIWGFLSSVLLESGELFTGAESYIKQIRLPYSFYVFRFVFGKVLIFIHDLPIYLAVILLFQIEPGISTLYAIPGMILLIVNMALVSMIVGLVSARFRDVPRVVASLVQITFLVTPIIWLPEMLGPYRYLATFNPLFHLIEIVRAPLLGAEPSTTTQLAILTFTFVNLLVASLLFVRFRARISYWI